jgi:hypothetical protein
MNYNISSCYPICYNCTKSNQIEYTKKVIGKIVTVKYNARIKDKSGVESLFLPVFIELREDKDNAESSKSIK